MTDCNIANRTIFLHDNIDILENTNSESIDLIYLDPPFNKNKKLAAPMGSSAEGAEFKDIFREEDLKEVWLQTIEEDQPELHHYLNGIKGVGKKYNFAYLAYMAIRLIECHRILKKTGAVYLHCDQTMSHYLKTTMDCVFGEDQFRNEIIWQRNSDRGKGSQHEPKSLGTDTDCLFFYTKSNEHDFKGVYKLAEPQELASKFPQDDGDGKGRYNTGTPLFCQPSMGARPNLCYTYKGVTNPHPSGWSVSKERLEQMDKRGEIVWRHGKRPLRKSYLSAYRGKPINNLWLGIPIPRGQERTGYPTQKPLALLERIISASSKVGDMVLDPFCGGATTCIASERLERQWIGIDVSHKAYDLVKQRLNEEVARPTELFGEEVHLTTKIPVRLDVRSTVGETKYVYIISHPNYPGDYKVGIAKDVKSRLNAYQTSDPDRAYKLEFSHETHLYRETEKHVHTVFDNKHEWVRGDLPAIRKAIVNFSKIT